MKTWSENEVKILVENYPKIGGKKCIPLLNDKSLHAIHQKAGRLGVVYQVDNYVEENFTKIVNESKSYSDVARKLSLKPTQNNRKRIKKYITKYNLDISHFTFGAEFYGLKIDGDVTSMEDYSNLTMNGKIKKVLKRPSYEELKEEVNSSSFLAAGRKYGVSDNTIRKWVKKYEKDLNIGKSESFLVSRNFNRKYEED
jgi:transposase-like protein